MPGFHAGDLITQEIAHERGSFLDEVLSFLAENHPDRRSVELGQHVDAVEVLGALDEHAGFVQDRDPRHQVDEPEQHFVASVESRDFDGVGATGTATEGGRLDPEAVAGVGLDTFLGLGGGGAGVVRRLAVARVRREDGRDREDGRQHQDVDVEQDVGARGLGRLHGIPIRERGFAFEFEHL